MVLQLSTRKSIRWVPNEASEPTSTIVFDIGDSFVDLRVKKADSSVDWGMCGKRTVLSEDPLKCQWTKEICSMGSEDSDDVAEFDILENGDAFEKGTMPNPDNGNELQDYEEVWGDLPIVPTDQPAWVLRRKDDKATTYLGRVSTHYQALRKSADGTFSALREESKGEEWETRYAINSKALPSIQQIGNRSFDARDWTVGEEVILGGEAYSVLELVKF